MREVLLQRLRGLTAKGGVLGGGESAKSVANKKKKHVKNPPELKKELPSLKQTVRT